MKPEELCKEIDVRWTSWGEGWRTIVSMDAVREIATYMRKSDARFASLVGIAANDKTLRVSWHWDLEGTVFSVETKLTLDQKLPSIVDIYPGADWAEREARDYFAVHFQGRESTPPLMLRQEDVPGILLPTEGGNA
jgi:NADH:ubiquinone oxidoreductase subunit C